MEVVMRLRVLFFLVVALSFPIAGPAEAQSPDRPSQPSQRGDGGLHVSNGGMVGYVGGSGSISGNVVGPGGTQDAAAEPAVEEGEPNAVMGGAVGPAQKATREVDDSTTQASSTGSNLLFPVFALLAVALIAFVVRGPLRARLSR